jgi:hypothetical protein
VERLELVSASSIEEGARLQVGPALLVDETLAYPVADEVMYRAGTLLGWLALGVPVAAWIERQALLELVKAGFMGAGTGDVLEPAEGTWELAERLRQSCTSGSLGRLVSLAEVSPSCSAAALEEGLGELERGVMRAGLLVSASVPGMLLHHRGKAALEGGEVRAFFESERDLRQGLSFVLSPSFARLRISLGLEF